MSRQVSQRSADRAVRAAVTIWVVAILANLAFWGFVVWAIVQLVQWVTAQ